MKAARAAKARAARKGLLSRAKAAAEAEFAPQLDALAEAAEAAKAETEAARKEARRLTLALEREIGNRASAEEAAKWEETKSGVSRRSSKVRPAAEVFEDNIGRVGSHPYLSSAEQARFERDRRIKLRDASRGDGPRGRADGTRPAERDPRSGRDKRWDDLDSISCF